MKQSVLVAMRDHALRRIVAGALRAAGNDVIEAFDEADMMSELADAPDGYDAILRDGRRDPESVLDALERLRAASIRPPVLLVVSRVTPSFTAEANRLRTILLGLPLTASDLRVALAALPRPARAGAHPDAPEPGRSLAPLGSAALGAETAAGALAAPRP